MFSSQVFLALGSFHLLLLLFELLSSAHELGLLGFCFLRREFYLMRHYLTTLLPVLELVGSIALLGVKTGPL